MQVVVSSTSHASQNGGVAHKGNSTQSHNGGFTSGLSDLFTRTTSSRDFDWI